MLLRDFVEEVVWLMKVSRWLKRFFEETMNQMKGLTFVGLVKCYKSINVIVLFHDPFLNQIHTFLKLIHISFITNHSLYINERSRIL